MYQTATPVGRRRSKAAERQAEIMRQHFAPTLANIGGVEYQITEVLESGAYKIVVPEPTEVPKPKRGRKAKAK
jgi:hypothetical protein